MRKKAPARAKKPCQKFLPGIQRGRQKKDHNWYDREQHREIKPGELSIDEDDRHQYVFLL
jgi:hypothetical protein